MVEEARQHLLEAFPGFVEFEIAGADGNFVPATAKPKGDTVTVSSSKVKEPAAVRFAWSEDAMPNLVNSEGLPASAFRTEEK